MGAGGGAVGGYPLRPAVNGLAAGSYGEVWESADGVAWAPVGWVPGADDSGSYLLFVPDGAGGGALYATNPGEREDLQVYVSHDRGRTWQGTGRIEAEAALGNPVRIREVVLGPEGRLYVGFTGLGPGSDGGVFRTVEPVVAVSAEGTASAATGMQLGAPYPNPALGPVTVPLALAQPGAVRLALLDVLGREVAVLHDGPLGPGEHAFRLDASALPAGVYVVRATGGASLARWLTVLR